jgi:hypothetical protein
MTDLLSLPEETITQIYIFAGENTRALVRLSAVNRRLRALWLQDSDHIITQSLELKAPGHRDAIALTLMEACCPMPVSGFHRVNASKDDLSLRLHPPGLMRNVGLASMVCTKTSEWQNSTYKEDFLPLEDLPNPYYLMRQLMVACHYPDLRQQLRGKLETLSPAAIFAWNRIECYLCKHSPVSRSHHIYDYDAPRTKLDDLDEPPPVVRTHAWDFPGAVFSDIFLADAYGTGWKPGDEYYAYGRSSGTPEWEQ